SGDAEISFALQAGKDVGRKANVAAEVTDLPRLNNHRLGGKVFVAAHPSESGRRVVVEVCLADVSNWDAGRFQGTIAVYGPKLADFTYAIVVTTKWPWWVAVGAIAL